MSVENDRIRIATSQPSLKNKVKTHLSGNTDVIYWYIRFNIPLDGTSVSEKTMDVTDTDGYIMRTDIEYDSVKNIIIISPLDTYEQNRFYLLSISKKVRSARGQYLRSTINILFKLYENQITDFKILKKDVKIPKPRPRPPDYDQQQAAKKANVKSGASAAFDQTYLDRTSRDKMATVGFFFNPVIGIIGIIIVVMGLIIGNLWVIIAGTLVCVLGLAHIYKQWLNKELSSTVFFNLGVRRFNKEKYTEAERYFKRAVNDNPKNELAKYGLYKISLYK
jgi:tetratricopeptide (TPR) repeat protein